MMFECYFVKYDSVCAYVDVDSILISYITYLNLPLLI